MALQRNFVCILLKTAIVSPIFIVCRIFLLGGLFDDPSPWGLVRSIEIALLTSFE